MKIREKRRLQPQYVSWCRIDIGLKKIHLVAHIGWAHTMNRIACNCGAIYEGVPKRFPRDPKPFKCLERGKELISGDYGVGGVADCRAAGTGSRAIQAGAP